MAVIPLSHTIRLDWFESFSQLETCNHESEIDTTLFNDCEPGAIPPVATPYGLQAIVDSSLLEQSEIYFSPGRYDQLIKIETNDFFALHRNSLKGEIAEYTSDYSRPTSSIESAGNGGGASIYQESFDELTISADRLNELPSLSDTAIELLAIQANPNDDFHTLAKIIKQDASLSAQLQHFVNSPHLPARHEVDSIGNTFIQSLGFDMTLNLAIAISINRSFDIPKDEPLGLLANWIHSIFSATLCQELVSLMPQPRKIDGATAYLTGLLHDIGFLLLGHVNRAEFNQLNSAIKANPETPIAMLEQTITGTSHHITGATLLKAWGLPKALVVAVKDHHNNNFSGEHHLYPALIRLSDHLLKTYKIGDAGSDKVPDDIYKFLSIDKEQAIVTTEKLMQRTLLFEQASIMVKE